MKESYEYQIKERTIAQGDLLLIINNERPTKSGWWRKIREGKSDDNLIYYILEKPIHKDFDINDEKLANTHMESGLFVMKDSTVRWCEKNSKDKYNILADVRGVDSIKLVNSNYDINSIDIESTNVRITTEFITFLEYYNSEKDSNILENVAKNCI